MMQQMNNFLCFSSLNWTAWFLDKRVMVLAWIWQSTYLVFSAVKLHFRPSFYIIIFLFFCSTDLILSLNQTAFFQMAVLPVWYNEMSCTDMSIKVPLNC